jgi:PEP-CTERM motif
MKLKFALAGLLAAASFSAMAADQTVEINAKGVASFDSVVIGNDGVLSGGLDVLTFNGVGPGLYDVVLTISGQNLSFDAAASTLNGIKGEAYSFGKLKFFGVEATTESPFVLNLAGIANNANAIYSGELTVAAVPEPSTYGMLLGGLGIMGFLARRKKQA